MTEAIQLVENSKSVSRSGKKSLFIPMVIALCPILQHYKSLFLDGSSDLFIIVTPYILLSLLSKKRILIKYCIPLILGGLWAAVCDGIVLNITGRELLLIIFYVGVENKIINMKKVIECAINIDIAATIILILQYICYYILGFHLQLVPTGLLKESAEQWILLAKTGRYSVTGEMISFYRPSAFFLEPSHMAIYSIPLLMYLLTARPIDKKKLKKAALISLGVLLSTSGIGIVLCIGTWGIYFVFYNIKSRKQVKFSFKKLFSGKTFLIVIAFAIVLCVGYFTVPFFRNAINRIFIPNSNGKNAMTARNGTGSRLVRGLSGKELMFGKGLGYRDVLTQWTIAGFYFTFVLNGLMGVLMSYLFFFLSIVKKIKYGGWLALFFVVLSFFSVHTYAAFYRFYFSAFILWGWQLTEDEARMNKQKIVSKLNN